MQKMKFLRIPFPHRGDIRNPGDLEPKALPVCDWVYVATPSQAGEVDTRGIISECRMIIRSAYNSAGLAIANAKRIKIGDQILVVYGGGIARYRPMFSCVAVKPPLPIAEFEAFSFADASFSERLKSAGYPRDPILRKFTGISIGITHDLSMLDKVVTKPGGHNTIRSWTNVFPVTSA